MTRLALVGGWLVLGGCAIAPKPGVWVDLSRVPPEKPDAATPAVPPVPGPLEGIVTLPGEPKRSIRVRPGADAASIATSLRRSQEIARRRLAERLRRFAAEEAAALRAAEEVKLDASVRERMAAREEAFRARFERYAAARSDLAVELAFLAGFPDPGRTPEELPERLRVRRAELARAETVRTELARLSAEFDRETARLLAADDALDNEARGALVLSIERKKAELERLADEDAARQVPLDTGRLPGRKLAGTDVALPAVPAASVRLAPTRSVPGWPGVPSRQTTERREELESELRIFLAERGQLLRRGAPDRTAEFFRWRTQYRKDGLSPILPPMSTAP